MEKVDCKCGKAYMTYECTGLDQYKGEAVNTEIKKEDVRNVCICKSCGSQYDNYDPCMVKKISYK
jgi:hypothetical protein